MKRRSTLLLLCVVLVFDCAIAQRYAVVRKTHSSRVAPVDTDDLHAETSLYPSFHHIVKFQYLKNPGAHVPAVRAIFSLETCPHHSVIVVKNNSDRCHRQLVVHRKMNALRD